MLDTVHRVATPEGVELTLHPAGPVPRAMAWLIDLIWRIGLIAVLSIVLSLLGRIGWGVMAIVSFALMWLVPAWLEARFGATPGKRAIGLRVLHDDGTPVAWPAALTRNLLAAADFLPMLYGFGLASMLLTRDFKRLGDLAAGTLVVHVAESRAAHAVPAFAPMAVAMPLSVLEQRAVLDFAERVPQLTAARAEELASIPRALTGDLSGRIALERMLAYANHLIGR
ncbi:RDD family protein [soil metagenome]